MTSRKLRPGESRTFTPSNKGDILHTSTAVSDRGRKRTPLRMGDKTLPSGAVERQRRNLPKDTRAIYDAKTGKQINPDYIKDFDRPENDFNAANDLPSSSVNQSTQQFQTNALMSFSDVIQSDALMSKAFNDIQEPGGWKKLDLSLFSPGSLSNRLTGGLEGIRRTLGTDPESRTGADLALDIIPGGGAVAGVTKKATGKAAKALARFEKKIDLGVLSRADPETMFELNALDAAAKAERATTGKLQSQVLDRIAEGNLPYDLSSFTSMLKGGKPGALSKYFDNWGKITKATNGHKAANTAKGKASTSLIMKVAKAGGWTVGATGLAITLGSSYPFALFGPEEGSQVLGFAKNNAERVGDFEGALAAQDALDELTERWASGELTSKLPIFNAWDGMNSFFESLQIANTVNRKVLEDKASGLTPAQQAQQTNEERFLTEKYITDYWNEQHLITREQSIALQTAADNARDDVERQILLEELKLWEEHNARQAELERQQREANAKFWLDYKKESLRLDEEAEKKRAHGEQSFSKLGFGII